MGRYPSWAGPIGLPSRHIAHAALHVAAVIDVRGSAEADARESYWHRATGGRFPPADLLRGQALLIDIGLLVQDLRVLRPTDALTDLLSGSSDDAIAALAWRVLATGAATHRSAVLEGALAELIPDDVRREEMLLHLAQRFDAAARAEVGDAGERLVLEALRAELVQLGRPDLARDVCRVSLISDQLGYDIRAPRIDGSFRRVEVKATTLDAPTTVQVFLSRCEAETAQRFPDWSLVACVVEDCTNANGSLLGWWSSDTLVSRLPSDSPGGHWEQVRLTLRVAEARPGIPSAVL